MLRVSVIEPYCRSIHQILPCDPCPGAWYLHPGAFHIKSIVLQVIVKEPCVQEMSNIQYYYNIIKDHLGTRKS